MERVVVGELRVVGMRHMNHGDSIPKGIVRCTGRHIQPDSLWQPGELVALLE